MNPRALSLIEQLGLRAHREGGYFREVFRSSSVVTPGPSGARRTAVTSMYYLLPAGQVSRLHRVTSDEIWHFLEGDPLELCTIDPSLAALQTHLIGPASNEARPLHAVPAHYWQAARPTGAFTLAGCTVGPGFEYEDFTLLADEPNLRGMIIQKFPGLAGLL
jgi:uncharacterized protein